MRLAITAWQDRISPVLDAANELLIVDIDEGGRETRRRRAPLTSADIPGRVQELIELDLDTLVCGAVSGPLASMIGAAGIELFPFVAGTIEEVLRAFLEGRLADPAFQMPGCCGRRRRGRHGMGRRGGHGIAA